MNNQVTVTKVGRSPQDNTPSFAFGMTRGGHGVYIPASIVRTLGWDENTAGSVFDMVLDRNNNDMNGCTPYMAKAMALKESQSQDAPEDNSRIEELQDEVYFHKLRGLMPWGNGTLEPVRRAVAPYGDEGEHSTIDEVKAEMVAMGFSEASAAPAVSLARKAGFITKDGNTITLTAEGAAIIKAKVEEYDNA